MAGSYQPEAMQQLAKIETPAFVAVIGKASIYQKDPASAPLVSVRVESISVVDKETRDIWTLDTAARTLDRIDAFATGTSPDILKAKEQIPRSIRRCSGRLPTMRWRRLRCKFFSSPNFFSLNDSGLCIGKVLPIIPCGAINPAAPKRRPSDPHQGVGTLQFFSNYPATTPSLILS